MIFPKLLNFINIFSKDKIDFLVCIYTCEQHRCLIPQFYSSRLGSYLSNLQNSRIIQVYADPDIGKPILRGNDLTLCTEEAYQNLSVKTYMMVDYLIDKFKFKYLIKVDITAVDSSFNPLTDAAHKNIDEEKLIKLLENQSSYKDYNGYSLVRAGKKGAENWAAKKGGKINYEKLFGDGNMPEYFSGKFYILSHKFAKYISKHGQSMAKDHAEYFMGSEDLMIGRLYSNFLNSN